MDSDFERLLYSHSQNLRQDVSRRFNAEGRGSIVKEFRQADQNGHPARPQPMATPQAYPLGYVEDVDEPRTKLGAVFNSRRVMKIPRRQYAALGGYGGEWLA